MTEQTDAPRRSGRKRGILLVLLSIAVLAGAIAAAQLTPSATEAAPVTTTVGPATSGTAYCPVTAVEGQSAQLEIASASPSDDSQIVITRFVDGLSVSGDPRLLEAGRSAVLDIPDAELGTPIAIDWTGGPVVAQYRLTDAAGRGTVGTCATNPGDVWHLAGFDTNRGNTSTLFLFNPFGQDAQVALRFGTTSGAIDLVIADEVEVAAGATVRVDLAEFLPEESSLAVTIEADVGRVVPQGLLQRGPAGDGLEAITGVALIPATSAASTELDVPVTTVDATTTSWLDVYNPQDRAAAVVLDVTTPLGTASQLAREITIPAGGTTRIELSELSALPRFGVRLRSVNDIGLVTTRGTARQDGDTLGLSAMAAAPILDTRWTVIGARGPSSVVSLHNPGDQVATARVQIIGDEPDSWASVTVPANGIVNLVVEGFEPGGAALIDSDLPIAAGTESIVDDQLSAAVGIPGFLLVGGGQTTAAIRDPGLSTRPALSATAEPTLAPLAPVEDEDGGEGQLDPLSPTPTPTPVVPPTPLPTATTMPGSTAAPTPSGDPQPTTPPSAASTPGPTPSPAPSPGAPADGATEEGSLFG